MTVPATRPAPSSPPIPHPRAVEPDVHAAGTATVPSAELPATQSPWPEPWRHSHGSRPRTDYWDVATASWHTCDPQPPSGASDRGRS